VEVKDGETTVARYAYDGLNHRITKTVGETITHAYYNSGWQLLETRVGAGAPETLDPKTQYVWSVRYIDALILRDRNNDENPDLEERLYYLNDANMNVTALIADDGTVLERYAYTPYGKPSFFDASWNPRAESAYDNAILYCGYYYDQETGLYHVRYRYLHPLLAWLSRDPAGYVEVLNFYAHGNANPIGSLDPSGTQTIAGTIGHGLLQELFNWAAEQGLQFILNSMVEPTYSFHVDEKGEGELMAIVKIKMDVFWMHYKAHLFWVVRKNWKLTESIHVDVYWACVNKDSDWVGQAKAEEKIGDIEDTDILLWSDGPVVGHVTISKMKTTLLRWKKGHGPSL
jgi:RHS repeat-associated protein